MAGRKFLWCLVHTLPARYISSIAPPHEEDRMYARSLLSLSTVALAAAAVALSAQKEVKKGTPPERILPLFMEEFVSLTPGKGKFAATFLMGSSAADAPQSEKPVHAVRFMAPFAIAKHEVTQELYQLVIGSNPAKWKGPRNSVEMVNWIEANEFCKRVTQILHEKKLLPTDEVIRLPSEAEWEYACRAGSKTAWSFGEKASDIGDYAWYKDNSKGEDPPVGRKKPNFWGLYDMHGYVSEWCADAWHPNYKGAPTDGSAWKDHVAKDRVIRGGSFADPAESHRSAFRDHKPIDTRSDRIGFRCVKSAAPVKVREERK
jgi:formylglycine-generating enzyme required for sulfatase activity